MLQSTSHIPGLPGLSSLSPMKTKEPGGANKDTATLGKFSSSGTFQPASGNFAPVCKVLLNPADGTQTFEKGKKGSFPSPSLSWQEVHCIYIFPPRIFKHHTYQRMFLLQEKIEDFHNLTCKHLEKCPHCITRQRKSWQ